MAAEHIQTLRLPFRLPVADPDQRQDGRDILHRQSIRVFRLKLTGCDKSAEDPGVVGEQPVNVPTGIQRRQPR